MVGARRNVETVSAVPLFRKPVTRVPWAGLAERSAEGVSLAWCLERQDLPEAAYLSRWVSP